MRARLGFSLRDFDLKVSSAKDLVVSISVFWPCQSPFHFLGVARGMPQNSPKPNHANDLRDFSGRLSGMIFDFLALDGLEARILWHRFLGSNRVRKIGHKQE
jgi:hypothetical protein